MGVELPIVAAGIARLPNEDINLAALGSLVYPLSLVIEAPIIMLLAASTALCNDGSSYRKLLRFTHTAGVTLTAAHILLAFTPLYDWVAVEVMGVQTALIEPGRLGLQIMTPWTWSIAYRRFQQGVLIRHEKSKVVVRGSVVRLVANVSTLLAGLWYGELSGIAVASLAIAVSVVAEAIYVGLRVQPILQERVFSAPVHAPALNRRRFLRFYLPLACTPLMTLLIQPIGAAAMNRMPEPLYSLAAWPVVYGLVFITRSFGFAFNEVVVALLQEKGSALALRRFARVLAIATMSMLGLIAFTPLARLWFGGFSDLSPEVLPIATAAVGFAILMPGYAVLQSWYQGALVKSGKTGGITEAVAIYLLTCCLLLYIGSSYLEYTGIYVALCSFTCAGVLQTIWLWIRSREYLAEKIAAG